MAMAVSLSSLFRVSKSPSRFFLTRRSNLFAGPIQMAAAAAAAAAASGSGSGSGTFIAVYVTVPTKEAGQKLAESIVHENLAACVNRVPGIESVYKWQGTIHTDTEELLIIKTRASLLAALTDHVQANHEYDVPEVIALPIVGGSIPYLEWIKNNTRD